VILIALHSENEKTLSIWRWISSHFSHLPSALKQEGLLRDPDCPPF